MSAQRSVTDRLMEKVRVNSVTGCWEWTAQRNETGYGYIKVGVARRRAHRVAYELFVGPIPEGMELDHLCRNRGCVNPSHLEPVTHRENSLRGVSVAATNAAKTHCMHGHEFNETNTIYRAEGGRACRVCRKERAHAFYQRHPERAGVYYRRKRERARERLRANK